MKKSLISKLPMILMIIGYLALQALPTKAQDTLAVSVTEHLAGHKQNAWHANFL